MDAEIVSNLMRAPLYDLDREQRMELLMPTLHAVTRNHFEQCAPYRKLCQKRSFDPYSQFTLEELPYLPTSIFKDTLLLSIPEENVFREINSSATTSGRPSRIGLDKPNNRRWSLSLQKMLLNRIGNIRYKTMVLDDESALGRSGVVSARASMTRSLLFCASDIDTCLVSRKGILQLDKDKLITFLKSIDKGQEALLFGFTFILYAHVIKPLLDAGERFDLPNLRIIHAGGWKKLESQKVSPEKLAELCNDCFGIPSENLIDIYGFSEQGGMLYPTCEHGFRHTPVWSDVICRDPLTLKPLPVNESGLMQFITPIQTSYPGHSVLTEDMGYIAGFDDCPCGRKGTIFKITGRSSVATEVRGCGDIMSDLFA